MMDAKKRDGSLQAKSLQLSAERAFCTGGHGTSPKEQKMQHFPSVGVMIWPHILHSYLTRQKLMGICSVLWKPHFGHRTVEASLIPFITSHHKASIMDGYQRLIDFTENVWLTKECNAHLYTL
jgi:hypothetical protein